jgi:hypothetical protein
MKHSILHIICVQKLIATENILELPFLEASLAIEE